MGLWVFFNVRFYFAKAMHRWTELNFNSESRVIHSLRAFEFEVFSENLEESSLETEKTLKNSQLGNVNFPEKF